LTIASFRQPGRAGLGPPGRPAADPGHADDVVRWIGVSGGADVVEAHIRWAVTADLDPAWEVAMAYLIEIHGHPQVNLRVEVLQPAPVVAWGRPAPDRSRPSSSAGQAAFHGVNLFYGDINAFLMLLAIVGFRVPGLTTT